MKEVKANTGENVSNDLAQKKTDRSLWKERL